MLVHQHEQLVAHERLDVLQRGVSGRDTGAVPASQRAVRRTVAVQKHEVQLPELPDVAQETAAVSVTSQRLRVCLCLCLRLLVGLGIGLGAGSPLEQAVAELEAAGEEGQGLAEHGHVQRAPRVFGELRELVSASEQTCRQ